MEEWVDEGVHLEVNVMTGNSEREGEDKADNTYAPMVIQIGQNKGYRNQKTKLTG